MVQCSYHSLANLVSNPDLRKQLDLGIQEYIDSQKNGTRKSSANYVSYLFSHNCNYPAHVVEIPQPRGAIPLFCSQYSREVFHQIRCALPTLHLCLIPYTLSCCFCAIWGMYCTYAVILFFAYTEVFPALVQYSPISHRK